MRRLRHDQRKSVAYWVPGRIEFLGKHTDYAGGRSLLCAVERGICILASPRDDHRLRIVDAAKPTEVLDSPFGAAMVAPPGHWWTYPITVAKRIARDFPGATRGADVAFANDLPIAAGMSSSSALVVAVFLALSSVNELESREDYKRVITSHDDLAAYLGAAENGRPYAHFPGDKGVGTFGGSEDHTAILCSKPRSLVQYSFCPVRFERTVPLPNDHELVIASSGVVAEKIGEAREQYNHLSLLTQTIAREWRDRTDRREETLGDILAAAPDAVTRLEQMIVGETPESRRELVGRFEQFRAESVEIIPAAGDALYREDLASLGELVGRSQDGAERYLGNQIRETISLAQSARELGAVAASAFGAGFGGSVWALVPVDGLEAFRERWAARYSERFSEAAAKASFFATRAGPPASLLWDERRS